MVNVNLMSGRRFKQLEEVDEWSPGMRQCVHEYGYPIVRMFMNAGVYSPRHIHMLVNEIWRGARQEGQRGGALDAADSLLSRGVLNTKTLVRFLGESDLVIATVNPTKSMVAASMAEVSGFNVRCTREEKHRLRLTAALKVAKQEMMRAANG